MIKRIVSELYNKQIDARGLALFRIVYTVVLLFQIKDMLFFSHLMFDDIPYINVAGTNFSLIIMLWMLPVIGIMLGIFTRINTILNYLFTLFISFHLVTFSSHIFFSFLEVNFLLMFLPVSRVWSVDRILLKLRYSGTKETYVPATTVSAMAYLLPVFFCIGLIYFESTFYKLADPYWLAGLGSWASSSLSITSVSASPLIVNYEILEQFLGYLTLVFEFLFVFMMWSSKLRWPSFLIGMGLHIGILLTFPIPFFALVMMSLYLLVVPVSVYKLRNNLKFKKTFLTFRYDPGNLPSVRKKIIIESLDALQAVALLPVQDQGSSKSTAEVTTGNNVGNPQAPSPRLPFNLTVDQLKQKLVLYFLIAVIVLQAVISYNSDLAIKARASAQFLETDMDDHLSAVSDAVCLYGTVFIGLTRNHLFTSNYLTEYTHIQRISYSSPNGAEIDLPLFDKQGMPGAYNRNSNWGNWTFFVCSPAVKKEFRDKGLRSYTAFWACQNNINLENTVFKIYTKPLSLPAHWEKDFLKKQINNNNWTEAGTIKWLNNHCTVTRFHSF